MNWDEFADRMAETTKHYVEETLARSLTQFEAKLVPQIAETVAAMIDTRLKLMVPELKGEPGKDGHDGIDGKDGSVGERGEKGEAGQDGEHGKDGTPGRDGIDGKDGAPGERGEKGDTGVGERGKKGEKGDRGDPGRDGVATRDELHELIKVGVAEAVAVIVPEVTETVRKTLPKVEYRGVWQEGTAYTRGDFVTWGGSLWHCNAATTAKPETNGDWVLAVKRGRDAKGPVQR